ncbi:hypothetical protein [Vibrio sp. HN007]|uniref:hypothetical protein n=1 Tax=Vibrio iocasae TaxID=3098914 RepID=UPI0035D4D4C5
MNKSTRSKTIAIISGLFLLAGLYSLNIESFGLAPLLVVVISFFMLIIHGYLYLSGRNKEDAFDVYQDSAKTKANALLKGLDQEK